MLIGGAAVEHNLFVFCALAHSARNVAQKAKLRPLGMWTKAAHAAEEQEDECC
jgi:hypothetical protein